MAVFGDQEPEPSPKLKKEAQEIKLNHYRQPHAFVLSRRRGLLPLSVEHLVLDRYHDFEPTKPVSIEPGVGLALEPVKNILGRRGMIICHMVWRSW